VSKRPYLVRLPRSKIGKVRVKPKNIGIAVVTHNRYLHQEIHAIWMTNWPF